MGNPLDITGRCIVCGERCESTGGCDCSAEDYSHVPLKRVWKRTLVDADKLAALQAKLAESEAQRAVLVAAREKARGKIAIGGAGGWASTVGAINDALANQPPSDLVALVKAAAKWRADRLSFEMTDDDRALAGALDTLFQNQPGFRALIESEGV